jgi:hypothetical protein
MSRGAVKPPATINEDGTAVSAVDALDSEVFQFYALAQRQGDDPARLGFPPLLPIEIVLRTAPVKDICTAYGLTKADYEQLRADPHFIAAVRKAKEMSAKEGWGFKMKALMQSEALLGASWTLIHAPDTPPAVKKDLILGTWRAAGVAEPEIKGGGQQNAFQININLGG